MDFEAEARDTIRDFIGEADVALPEMKWRALQKKFAAVLREVYDAGAKGEAAIIGAGEDTHGFCGNDPLASDPQETDAQ